jgi:hypothetical protein
MISPTTLSTRLLRALCPLLALLWFGCPDLDRRRGAGDDDDGADDDDDDDATDDDDDGTDDDDADANPCTAPARLTNVGCIFWAVDLDNAENFVDDAAAGQFAVAVANVHDEPATVVVRINTAAVGDPVAEQFVESTTIDPGDLYVFRLPRRDVDGENVVDGTDDGTQTWLSSRAFHIVSTAPVVAYQFNTLDQQFSNDASLLLPDRALAREHVVLGYSPGAPTSFFGAPANRSYVTIVGTAIGTEVTVTPTADIVAGDGVPALNPGAAGLAGRIGIAAGTDATFTLGPFDVLNLETLIAVDLDELFALGLPDLSGTRVSSTEPVAVFTGVDLTAVTTVDEEGSCCAEHIEQQVLPTRVMRSDYVVSRSAVRNEANPEPDVYRILASTAGTTVTTTLPGADASFTLGAGEFREFSARTGFVVESSGPLHVAQFLVQGTEAGAIGDSALLYVLPVQQRRASYTLTTGEGFSENWIVISGVEGTAPRLDGRDMAAAGCSGPVTDGVHDGSTYVAWTCPVADGVHQVFTGADVGDEDGLPIAVYVYGYYSAGSYAYPGGASLD